MPGAPGAPGSPGFAGLVKCSGGSRNYVDSLRTLDTHTRLYFAQYKLAFQLQRCTGLLQSLSTKLADTKNKHALNLLKIGTRAYEEMRVRVPSAPGTPGNPKCTRRTRQSPARPAIPGGPNTGFALEPQGQSVHHASEIITPAHETEPLPAQDVPGGGGSPVRSPHLRRNLFKMVQEGIFNWGNVEIAHPCYKSL